MSDPNPPDYLAPSRALPPHHEPVIREFSQEVFRQVERLDKLGLELVKIVLAIPSAYTAALPLVWNLDAGKHGAYALLPWLLWVPALICGFAVIMPKRRSMRPTATAEEIVRQYQDIAKGKFWALITCVALFLVGVFTAALVLLFLPSLSATETPKAEVTTHKFNLESHPHPN